MRQHLRLGLLAVVTVLGLAPRSLAAQCRDSFPPNFVPFLSVYYISDPNTSGDRLVVGRMSLDAFQTLGRGIPLPYSVDEKFCNQIELAPGFFADAYVPRLSELGGISVLLTPSCLIRLHAYPSPVDVFLFPGSRTPSPGVFHNRADLRGHVLLSRHPQR
jgi:hypothetical protein